MDQVLQPEEVLPTTAHQVQVKVRARVTALHPEVHLQEAVATAEDHQAEVRVVALAEAQVAVVVQVTEDKLQSIQSNSNKQLILKS